MSSFNNASCSWRSKSRISPGCFRRRLPPWIACLACLAFCSLASQADDGDAAWVAPLSAMPLPADMPALTRSNAIRVVLESVRSNGVVKAIAFLPGVADDFYLIHRDHPLTPGSSPRPRHLAEAISTLTNHSAVRASFTNGMLLLRTDADPVSAAVPTAAPGAKPRPDSERRHRVLWVDAHWRTVQPALSRMLKQTIRPPADSQEAWHFERVNLAAFGISDEELLQAIAVTTGTRVLRERRSVTFDRSAAAGVAR